MPQIKRLPLLASLYVLLGLVWLLLLFPFQTEGAVQMRRALREGIIGVIIWTRKSAAL